MTLLYLVAAWIAGLVAASSAHASTGLWLLLTLLCSSLALVARSDRRWRLAFVCGMFFAAGAARSNLALREPGPDHVGYYTGSGYVTLAGTVTRPPDPRDTYTALRVDVDTLTSGSETRTVDGTVLVQAPRYGEYRYGDHVSVGGMLLTPPEFDGFSYRDYLARQGIRAMIQNAQVSVLDHGHGLPWLSVLYDIRARAGRAIDQQLPSPQAPLLSGILLGDESSIPDDVQTAFQRTGTAHIVAISGSNIVIVIGVLMGLLQPSLGRRRAAWITLIGVAAYTVFVGAAASVVRAAAMGGLAIFAAQTGRRAHGLTTLAFAAWLMTLWNPQVLWDVGFQLSVAATAGLVFFSHGFERALEAALARLFAADTARQITRWLSEPIAVSLAAQVATLPLILLYFGQLSLVSLIANALIVPLQPYVMLAGGLAAIAGLILPVLGQAFAWIAWIPLTLTIEIVRGLADLDWASFAVTITPNAAWIVTGLLAAAGLIGLLHPDDRAELFAQFRQRVTTYSVAVAGAILAVLIWTVALQMPDGKLHVWYLDVGHGNAMLIQTPEGAKILVNGGPNPTELRRAVGDVLPFWDHTLDVLIVTEPSPAEVSALPSLLDSYTVHTVVTNGQDGATDTYQALMQRWESQQAQSVAASAGYIIRTDDGVQIEVLHPAAIPQDAGISGVALALRLTYGDASFLIAPDLDTEGVDALLASNQFLGSTVLTLAGHGDDNTNTPELLAKTSPQAAVVMVGAGQRSGLPDAGVLADVEALTGQPVYRTDQDGTVEFVTDGASLSIYTLR
ncbi:MAG TPA: ComEC/Rec2 family competence protein [Aggregatilinea sp.]|uniref:ComEC/Rec2 family competence protein n=1 Tax=Aggregatilinea sp. TaxID=2806333 RepID=UPI002C0A136C|nr:ComEC/Rec2 family competence protein [Aggregatilinea sp.]HML20095.1 ComEC/Rec2 family competence protein [Aggregatilinea sp.]